MGMLHAAALTLAASASMAGAPVPRERVVLLDPGHGGRDPGAIAPDGVREKDVALRVALRTRDALARRGWTVRMTRSTDVAVPLRERAAMAQAARADLLVSIHCDSSDAGGSGSSVWLLRDDGPERPLRIADADPETLAILDDLGRRAAANGSAAFASALASGDDALLPRRRDFRREAHLAVLRSPTVPSALVELGYLSDPSDRARLESAAGARDAAEAIAGAVDAWLPRRADPDGGRTDAEQGDGAPEGDGPN